MRKFHILTKVSMLLSFIILIFGLLNVNIAKAVGSRETSKATVLPLPRFASLRSNKVRMRTGPGFQYPVSWVYLKSGLPVKIISQLTVWRKVQDWQGNTGWVHSSMLRGVRNFIVHQADVNIYQTSSKNSWVIARLAPRVIGHVDICEKHSDWCQVSVGEYQGWVTRDSIWGVLKGESIK